MVNLDKLCRTCLSPGILFAGTSKCQINGEFISVQDMLKECTDINISNADCLPKRMCAACIVGVRTSYTFRLQSLQTQKYIVELLNNLKSDTSDVTLDMVISLKDKNIKQYKKPSSNATNQDLNVSNCSDLNISIDENIDDNFENDITESNQYDNNALEHCFNPISNHNEYTDSDQSVQNDLPLRDNVDEHSSGKVSETEHKSSTNNKQQKFKIDLSNAGLDRLGLKTSRKRAHRPFVCSCGADYVRESDLLTHFKLQGHFPPGVQATDESLIFRDPLDIEFFGSECDYNEDLITPEPILGHDDASSVKIEPGILLDSLEDKDETRPYVCECGRSYVRKSDLVRHCKHKKHEVRKKNMAKSVFAAKKWPQITIVNAKKRSPMVKREVIDRQDVQEELEYNNQHVNNIHVEDSDIFAFAVNIDSSDENSIMEVGRTGKPYKYLCTCGTKYCRKSDFVRHVKWKHIKTENKPKPEAIGNLFTCSECSEVFDKMENFKAHVETTHRQVRCDICGIVFHGTLKAEAHQKLQHNISHKCSVCHKICSTRNNLKSHQRQHLPVRQYLCSYCGKSFRSSSFLKVHIRTHTNERPYICLHDGCGKAFYTKTLLTAHWRTHTLDKPFKCEHCPRRFTIVGNLNIHKRIHSDERPYKCSICPAAFKNKSTLISHNRTHTGEKPFPCEICNISFTTKRVLLIHTRIHTKERPYKCKLCNFGGITRYMLTRHISRRHTGKREFTCKYVGCDKMFFTPSERSKHQTRHLKMNDQLKPTTL